MQSLVQNPVLLYFISARILPFLVQIGRRLGLIAFDFDLDLTRKAAVARRVLPSYAVITALCATLPQYRTSRSEKTMARFSTAKSEPKVAAYPTKVPYIASRSACVRQYYTKKKEFPSGKKCAKIVFCSLFLFFKDRVTWLNRPKTGSLLVKSNPKPRIASTRCKFLGILFHLFILSLI